MKYDHPTKRTTPIETETIPKIDLTAKRLSVDKDISVYEIRLRIGQENIMDSRQEFFRQTHPATVKQFDDLDLRNFPIVEGSIFHNLLEIGHHVGPSLDELALMTSGETGFEYSIKGEDGLEDATDIVQRACSVGFTSPGVSFRRLFHDAYDTVFN